MLQFGYHYYLEILQIILINQIILFFNIVIILTLILTNVDKQQGESYQNQLSSQANAEFNEILEEVLKSEGGKSNHKNDRGGVTNKGITQTTYNSYCQEKGIPQKHVYNLTNSEVNQYYKDLYIKYKAHKINDFKTRYMYFDFVITSGPSTAIRKIQQSCGTKVDRSFGPQTEACTNNSNQMVLQKRYMELRRNYFSAIINKDNSQKVFEKGWRNRLNKVENYQQKQQTLNIITSQQHNIQEKKDANIEINAFTKIKGINKLSQNFIIDKIENISISLAVVLAVYYDNEIRENDKFISFSLDPISTNNKEDQFTLQEKVCWPDRLVNRNIIADTQFAKVLFQADFLLKQMSLGCSSDGKTEFSYPIQLAQKGLKAVNQFSKNDSNEHQLWRFWLVPDICNVLYFNNRYIIQDIKVKCQARQLELINGELKDQINQNENDCSYLFAQKFTELYDEISFYFPVFERLKQLFKAVALGKWMYVNKIEINFNSLKQYIQTVNNMPFIIPILTHSQEQIVKITNLYYNQSEKNQIAKDYLIKNDHLLNQQNIIQIINQIPDIKGTQYIKIIQKSSNFIIQIDIYLQGGIDPNCKNVIYVNKEKNKLNQQDSNQNEINFEIYNPLFFYKQCQKCQRIIESYLYFYKITVCALCCEYTCNYCMQLITDQDINSKPLIIDDEIFVFHPECLQDQIDRLCQQNENEEHILQRNQLNEQELKQFDEMISCILKQSNICDLSKSITFLRYDSYCKQKGIQQDKEYNLVYNEMYQFQKDLYIQCRAHQINNFKTRYMYFECAMNCGPSVAIKNIQTAYCAKADGKISDETITCINTSNQIQLQTKFHQQLLTFISKLLENNDQQQVILVKWQRKLNEIKNFQREIKNQTFQEFQQSQNQNIEENYIQQNQNNYQVVCQNCYGYISNYLIKLNQDLCLICNNNTCNYCSLFISQQDIQSNKIEKLSVFGSFCTFHKECLQQLLTIIIQIQ